MHSFTYCVSPTGLQVRGHICFVFPLHPESNKAGAQQRSLNECAELGTEIVMIRSFTEDPPRGGPWPESKVRDPEMTELEAASDPSSPAKAAMPRRATGPAPVMCLLVRNQIWKISWLTGLGASPIALA